MTNKMIKKFRNLKGAAELQSLIATKKKATNKQKYGRANLKMQLFNRN